MHHRFTFSYLQSGACFGLHKVLKWPPGATVFRTVASGTLSPSIRTLDLEAVCIQTGVSGNGFAAGQVNTLVNPIDGVTAVNTTVPTGGAAEESDEAYRQRILLAPESFSVAGPVGAYEYFARRVSPAICDVHVGNLTGSDGLPIRGGNKGNVI